MPRHDPSKTPPEKRRARKGSTVDRLPNGSHTVESFSAQEAIQARRRVGEVQAIRLALVVASSLPDDHPAWKEALEGNSGDAPSKEGP